MLVDMQAKRPSPMMKRRQVKVCRGVLEVLADICQRGLELEKRCLHKGVAMQHWALQSWSLECGRLSRVGQGRWRLACRRACRLFRWFVDSLAEVRGLRRRGAALARQHSLLLLRASFRKWLAVRDWQSMACELGARYDAGFSKTCLHEWWTWQRKCASVRRLGWISGAAVGFTGLASHCREEIAVRMGTRVVARRRTFAVVERWRTTARERSAAACGVARRIWRQRVSLLLLQWRSFTDLRMGLAQLSWTLLASPAPEVRASARPDALILAPYIAPAGSDSPRGKEGARSEGRGMGLEWGAMRHMAAAAHSRCSQERGLTRGAALVDWVYLAARKVATRRRRKLLSIAFAMFVSGALFA